MSTHPHTTDIAIIGAGPVGLFTVFEMGMLGYTCALLDSLPEAGGQLQALYPEKPIYDIPAFPTVLAGDVVQQLMKQAEPFAPDYFLGDAVTTIAGEANNFTLTAGNIMMQAKVIVIAAGAGVFAPRKPPLANLEQFENISVFYAVHHKQQYANHTVVIAGGGDAAADWAVELAHLGAFVHLVHRRAEFRAAEATVQQMHTLVAEGKLIIHTPCQLHALRGKDGQISQVDITDLDGQITSIPATRLLCLFGLSPSLGPIADWGLNTTGKKVVVNPATMETTRPGILAVGDITDYPGKLDLILTGFAESAIAAKTAQAIIHPEKKFRLVYTTSSGLPTAPKTAE